MKVLEVGPGWSVQERCTGKGNGEGGCNSLLEVEKEDIYLTSHTDLTGDTDYYYTFRCAVCGVETDLNESKVPSIIRRRLLERKRNNYR